jgi:hypothetical protein
MSETIIIKDYINEILEFKTISVWIIYTNMLKTIVNSTFVRNEPLDFAYTLGLQLKFLLANDNFLYLHIVKFPCIHCKILLSVSFCGIL